MDPQTALLLFSAGICGGIMNAIAGGATFITFPAMMAAGLPPIIANASNSVAIMPGNLLAAWADRGKLPPLQGRTAPMIAAAFLGGIIGSLTLLATPERVFNLLIPALIGIATLVFASSSRIQAGLARKAQAKNRPALRLAVLTAISAYGGYFGAGVGIMMLAALSITDRAELRTLNALKNLLSTAVAAAAAIIFIAKGGVSWPQTLVMLSGAILGGFAGGKLVQVLPTPVVRRFIIFIGSAMTAVYAWRYWL
jgi:uncharacterized protein